jgi:hypothetical protein
MAAGAVLATVIAGALPVAAQTVAPATTVAPPVAPSGQRPFTAWTAGQNATGQNMIFGRVEQPRGKNGIVVSNGTVAVSGWFVDLLALNSGWAGADQMNVTIGGPQGQGTDVADGYVGGARQDIADLLGSGYARNSGYAASFSASVLQVGQNQLWINLHTPHGWYYKSLSVTVNQAQNLNYPTDPIVALILPNNYDMFKQGGNGAANGNNFNGPGANIDLFGFALDRNVMNITDPANTSVGLCNTGIQSISLWVDYGQPSQITIPVSNCLSASNGRLQHGRAQGEVGANQSSSLLFKTNPCPACQYGQNFIAAQFEGYLNATRLVPGAHTAVASAISSVSKNVGWSQTVTFTIESPNP